jgi:hypothetical protein
MDLLTGNLKRIFLKYLIASVGGAMVISTVRFPVVGHHCQRIVRHCPAVDFWSFRHLVGDTSRRIIDHVLGLLFLFQKQKTSKDKRDLNYTDV